MNDISRKFSSFSQRACSRSTTTQAGGYTGGLRAGRPRAFTLIEVLATLVFLGIILPAAMRGVSIALAMASHARHATEAAQLAEAKLNELIATNTWSTSGSGDFGTDHPGYQWRLASEQRDFGLSQITITVAW